MIDQLILKALTENLSLEERHRLNKWLDEDPAHRKMMEALEMYWENSQYDLDQERVMLLNRIRANVNDAEQAGDRPAFPLLRRYLQYAAILICVSAASILVYRSVEPRQEIAVVRHTETHSLPGQNIDLALPDGTKVKLNAGSKLVVPDEFRGNTREVELTGEAFFDVKRDPAHPFIVKMKGMEVEVLGTSFVAKAYDDEPEHMVAVKTGLVNVRSFDSKEAVSLAPNEMTVVSQRGMKKQIVKDDSNVFGWIKKEIAFRDEPIGQVLKEIERWYGVHITVQRRLQSDKLYTAHHYNPPIEDVLRSLGFVYGFKFEINNDEVIIK